MVATIDNEKTGSLALSQVNERNLYTGQNLSELMNMASVERELALVPGSNDELEIEAIYSMETSEWLVQVFNHSDILTRSLYEPTN